MLDIKKPIVYINLTPLVDVSLVLVVIFMATAPMFLQSGIIVTAGEKKVSQLKKPTEDTKSILIKLEGEDIWLNQQKVLETELPAVLASLLSSLENKRVIVSPDRAVRHGKVVRIMDIAKQAGAEHLVVLGKTQEQPDHLPSQGKP